MRIYFPIGFAILGGLGLYGFWNMNWAIQIISITFLCIVVIYSFAVEYLNDVLHEDQLNVKEVSE